MRTLALIVRQALEQWRRIQVMAECQEIHAVAVELTESI